MPGWVLEWERAVQVLCDLGARRLRCPPVLSPRVGNASLPLCCSRSFYIAIPPLRRIPLKLSPFSLCRYHLPSVAINPLNSLLSPLSAHCHHSAQLRLVVAIGFLCRLPNCHHTPVSPSHVSCHPHPNRVHVPLCYPRPCVAISPMSRLLL